jgi:hypothetical protein
VKAIGTGLDAGVDDGTGGTADLGVVVGGLDLELRQRLGDGLDDVG